MMYLQPNYHCDSGVVASVCRCFFQPKCFFKSKYFFKSPCFFQRQHFPQTVNPLIQSNALFFTYKVSLNKTSFQVLNRIVALVKAFNDNERHFWPFSRTFTRMEPLK